jgi:phospholipid:diacylglycerol acyltransferase
MSLDNETGLDKPGIRVRPVTGLVAADYFVPGYFVWGVLIANLARIGYEEKTMYMAAYDWRLSFQNTILDTAGKKESRLFIFHGI